MTPPSLLARLSQAFLCLLLASLAFASPAAAERIQDLGTFQRVRANQLTGYGIVVGLADTGDDSLDYAPQGVKGMSSSFGLRLEERRVGKGFVSRCYSCWWRHLKTKKT